MVGSVEVRLAAGIDRFGFAGRLGLFYAATFFLTGMKVTYLPVWLDWRGLSAQEIGWIGAAPLFLRVFATPAIAFAADRFATHRPVLIALAWASVVMLFGLAQTATFWPILALTLLLALASTTIMPLTETIAMTGVRQGGHDYGRMRLWGSLSFIVAGYLAGIGVDWQGVGALLPMLVFGAGLVGLSAHLLPVATVEKPDGTGLPKRQLTAGDTFALLRSWPFICFLLAAGAVQAAHALFYTFGVLLWRQQGLSTLTISSLWAVGVIAEIILFAYSGAVVRAIGAGGLLLAGALAGIVRWTLMAFDPGLAALVVLQALHGLTFGATHLGAVHFIAANVPNEQAGTAQALHSSVTAGIAMGLATLLAGRLFSEFGGRAYLAMTALSVAGLAAALVLYARRKGEHRA